MERVSRIRVTCAWLIGIGIFYGCALALRFLAVALDIPFVAYGGGEDDSGLSYFEFSSALLSLILGVWAGAAIYDRSIWMGGDRGDRLGLLCSVGAVLGFMMIALISGLTFRNSEGYWIGLLRFVLELGFSLAIAVWAYRWWNHARRENGKKGFD